MEGEGSPKKNVDAQARDAAKPQILGRGISEITKLSEVVVGLRNRGGSQGSVQC